MQQLEIMAMSAVSLTWLKGALVSLLTIPDCYSYPKFSLDFNSMFSLSPLLCSTKCPSGGFSMK